MTMTPENWRKRMDEIQAKNDAYLAAHIPSYDPEKAKASREKLRAYIEKKRAENQERTQ